ncbi:phage baseplate assembly protein V [Parasegetibacter sp. NRK P23]|uniref:phage baseplate assembly protein V n=1 Tax=Parasegetibacter sp. NRK P23 TaxID=2942999 RepID=UPI0020440BF2|nr:phage baseplate assembly protein V [Parasegetibacter sp. NRK P23]MCM5528972.1 phage baseplate assembly protein V [Parasegetibacter sp. NRK P23]
MKNFKTGIISEAKPGFAKVYFEEDEIVTTWWPIVVKTSMKDFESWPLNVKEHVVCLTDEHCEEGVIIGCIHSKPEPPDPGAGAGKFRKVFEDGTVLEYEKGAHKLTADVKGPVSIKSTAKAELEAVIIECSASASVKVAAPVINLDGNVSISGTLAVAGALSAAGITATGGSAISATGNIETTGELKGGSVKAGLIDLATHKHPGVQTGSGQTGVAIP